MKTVVIVQARMTSTRLPGKVMLPLGDKTVLGHVLSRCWQIEGVDEVCCAIPVGSEHDVLIDESQKYNATVFRGSEKNVLERYYEAAKFTNADIIMRVTSDCPLINPEVCSDVIELHKETKSDFTCNNTPPSWPQGYDCEVFGIKQLEDAYKNALEDGDFEHVTPWIRRTVKIRNLENPKGNEYHIRITLDTQYDYENITKMFINGDF